MSNEEKDNPNNPRQAVIELKNVTKSYMLGDIELPVIRGIDIEIDLGELVSIMGPSGSGKTTTMNIIGLLDHVTSGSYYLNGRDVSTLSSDELAETRNFTIGFVFQFFYLLPRLTALQNVCLPLTYRDVPTAEVKRRALENLRKVGMQDRADHRPNQLSGGQQQRVAIARALIGEPKVLLADEPTGALDSKTGKELMQLLIELNKREKTTIVIVTHDINVARQCERVIQMADGKIVFSGKLPPANEESP